MKAHIPFQRTTGEDLPVSRAPPPVARPPEAQAPGAASQAAQVEEGVSGAGETQVREDASAGHARAARDGRGRGGDIQRQGVQPGRDQGTVPFPAWLFATLSALGG